jgi:Spermine/spermidine synthase domain
MTSHDNVGNSFSDKELADRKSLAFELFILSLSSLFFELLIIRWLGSSFQCFSVFKTFPLVACFVGLGAGVAIGKDRLFRYTPVALLSCVVLTQCLIQLGVGDVLYPSVGLFQWHDFGQLQTQALITCVVIMMADILILLAGPFAVMLCLGSRIGALFNQQKPLTAYCIDIGGAITGSLLFGLMAYFWMPPYFVVAVFSALVLFYVQKVVKPTWLPAVTMLAAVFIGWMPNVLHGHSIWSPYSRIERSELVLPAKYTGKSEAEDFGYELTVNTAFQQAFTKSYDAPILPEARDLPALKSLIDVLEMRKNYYGLPYRFSSPADVLILGAGCGSDVKEAVSQNAQSVDGVEIDPAVIHIGMETNPAYKSDKVHIYCNDARNFINRAEKKYDMIIFACLDSTAVSGVGSAVRTDSYIHTMQSYRRCLALLKPNGLLVVSFGAARHHGSHWLRDRMFETLKTAAGYPPLLMTDEDAKVFWPAYVYILGEPVRGHELKPPVSTVSFTGVNMPDDIPTRTLSDDYPYLYVRNMVDLPYLAVLLEVVIVSLFAGRSLIFGAKSAIDGQLFFLGSAFILIELQAISRLSLLYGATWVTTSIVINVILLMILASNFAVIKFGKSFSSNVLYLFLFASLAVSYFLPTETILGTAAFPEWFASSLITLLTLAPMFMAGLIFATSFSQVAIPARSFGFNLLGSVMGSLLEYASAYFGVKSLVLFAIALYACSFICLKTASKENAGRSS